MEDFKRQGGSLGGREERTDSFGGEPRSVGGTLGGHGAKGSTSLTEPLDKQGHHTGHHSGHNTGHHHNDATNSSVGGAGLNDNTTGMTGTHRDGNTSSNMTGTSTGNVGTHHAGQNEDLTGTHKKPSLMDKLNPKIDSNGDGKAGFMK